MDADSTCHRDLKWQRLLFGCARLELCGPFSHYPEAVHASRAPASFPDSVDAPLALVLSWSTTTVLSPGASSRKGSIDSVTPSVGQKQNTIFDGVEMVVCSPPGPSRFDVDEVTTMKTSGVSDQSTYSINESFWLDHQHHQRA